MQPIQGQYVIRPDPVYHTPKFQHIGYQFRPWPAIAVALGIVLQGHYCGHFIRRFWQKVDAPRLAMLATNKWCVGTKWFILSPKTNHIFCNRWRGAFIGVAGAAVGSIPGVVYASLFTPLERYFETREEDRSIGELVRELFGAAIPALFLGAVVSAPLTVPFGSLSGAAIGYIFRKRVFAAASIVKWDQLTSELLLSTICT